MQIKLYTRALWELEYSNCHAKGRTMRLLHPWEQESCVCLIAHHGLNHTQENSLYNLRLAVTSVRSGGRCLYASVHFFYVCEGPFILTLCYVAVPIYRSLSATSHRSIAVFQVKMNLTFMWHLKSHPNFCAGYGAVRQHKAMQLRHNMNRPWVNALQDYV